MRRLKSLFLILLALWLPVQAAAAVTMSFCPHAAEPVAVGSAGCHEPAAPAAGAHDLACDGCQLCQLASSGFLVAAAGPEAPPRLGVLAENPGRVAASHIPEPPQQPPRS